MNSFNAWLKKLKEAVSGHPGIDFTDLQGNFTPRAQTMVDLARKLAVRLNHPFLGSEHLLLGLMKRSNVELNHARQEILRELDPNFGVNDDDQSEEGKKEEG